MYFLFLNGFTGYTVVSLLVVLVNNVYWNEASANSIIAFNAIFNGALIQKLYIIIIIVIPVLYNIEFDNTVVINKYILSYNVISFNIAK